PRCFERRVRQEACTGINLGDEGNQRRQAAQPMISVCDACRSDAHCSQHPGGRCLTYLPGASVCDARRNACVYPGEPCYPSGQCTGSCLFDGNGGVTCSNCGTALPKRSNRGGM